MRLDGKIAVVIGAGQSPGEGIGNGRATALRFAQEGARILAVDRDLAAAEATAALARMEGGEFFAFTADVTRGATLAAAMQEAVRAGAASTSCTIMSGSASAAATSRSRN
jgi:NAD(P)-dependent dehydrogenase (short-subunit alcohol dehydrogenase family)